MTELENWIKKIFSDTSVIKLGLENIKSAARVLKLSKPAPYVVTVAGTNGKGTVVKSLEFVLSRLGYKTGCYTSPHLVRFNERITINNTPLDDKTIVAGFNHVDTVLKANGITLTFFEFITITAWNLFQQRDIDILICEIGLGGRLDAVNAIPKDLAVITSVDLDHQHLLGDTIEKIGREKAGVITKDCLVVLGDKVMPNSVMDQAKKLAKFIYQYGYDYSMVIKDNNSFDYYSDKELSNKILIELNSNCQLKNNNIATCLKVLEVLDKNYKKIFNQQKILDALKKFHLIGRCAWYGQDRKILFDVAHNPQSINNLTTYLRSFKHKNKLNIIAICGMLSDKNIEQCLQIINPVINQWKFVSIPDTRGVSANELARKLTAVSSNRNYTIFENFASCYSFVHDFLKKNSEKSSILVVFGSFHVVGPVYNSIKTL